MPDPWLLRYGATEFEFSDESGIFLRGFPEISSYEVRDQDQAIYGTDGDRMGVDTLGGRTLGLSFGIEGRTEGEARARRATLERLWNAREVRRVGGAVAELVDLTTGRVAVGRPREIANKSVRLHDSPPGYDVEANFRMIDPVWYGEKDVVAVPLVSESGGGFVFPIRFPLVMRGYTRREGSFTIEGDFPTWGVIRIPGPVLNPTVSVRDVFTFSAATSLAYDEWIEIDTRPGRRSVTRNGNTVQALTRGSTPLDAAELPLGPHQFVFAGSSASGNPPASLEWAPAYSIT
jgi:hypothetical protein